MADRSEPASSAPALPTPTGRGSLSRRTLLAAAGLGAGVSVLLTAGQTAGWLAPLNAFAPRVRDLGPQGLPVNRTSAQAGVARLASDPTWVLTLSGPAGTRTFSLGALRGLPSAREELPIACVEGWSADAVWDGVRLRDLTALVGAGAQDALRVTSLEPRGSYRVTEMPAAYASDPRTLVALGIGGEPLHLEHGYPARVIAPGRPGVLQTKWLSRIEVV